jgi:hypothetical protein
MKYWRVGARIAGSAILLFAAYCAILCFPSPFFHFSVRANGLTLHSDRALPADAAQHVLQRVQSKLATSPPYSRQSEYDIFLCNSRWRQRLYFNKDYGVVGVAPYPITSNVFLRDASIEDNRLIGPRGTAVPGDRTLDYFIAHEITHQVTGRAIGPLLYFRLPQWVREGYADYVGKGGTFNYSEAREAFLANGPEMDWKRSGLYWRYHLLVACLLDGQGWSVDRLLRTPPKQESVEALIKAGT